MADGLRGFAYMKKHDPDRLKNIAASGGKSVADENRAFSKDNELASRAGRLGGLTNGKHKL